MTTIAKINQREAVRAIARREPFVASALSGKRASVTDSLGRLPREYRDGYYMAAERGAYAVFSYGTPVAWVTDEGAVTVPAERYSVTTSKHQSIARRGL